MTSKRVELKECEMNQVVGGFWMITGSTNRIGKDRDRMRIYYTFDDVDAVNTWINNHPNADGRSTDEDDDYVINGLLAAGLIHAA